jgi:hypothetical protein
MNPVFMFHLNLNLDISLAPPSDGPPGAFDAMDCSPAGVFRQIEILQDRRRGVAGFPGDDLNNPRHKAGGFHA